MTNEEQDDQSKPIEDIEEDEEQPHVVFTTDLTSMTRHVDKEPADTGLKEQYPANQEPQPQPASTPPPASPPPVQPQQQASPQSGPNDQFKSQTLSGISQNKTVVAVAAVAVGFLALIGVTQLIGGMMSGGGTSTSSSQGWQQGELSVDDIYHRAEKSTVLVKTFYKVGKVSTSGHGTGWFVKPHLVATNYHVAFLKIPFKKGRKRGEISLPYTSAAVKPMKKDGVFPVKALVGYDKKNDLALLWVPGLEAPGLKIRDHKTLKVGEKVHAFGCPGPLEGVLNSGSISYDGLRESTYIQHNAAIGPGMSGGPLFDANANVLGLNTLAVVGRGGKYEHADLNYAVAVRKVKELLEKPRVKRKLKKLQEKTEDESGFSSE